MDKSKNKRKSEKNERMNGWMDGDGYGWIDEWMHE